jgi:hypothetical protein
MTNMWRDRACPIALCAHQRRSSGVSKLLHSVLVRPGDRERSQRALPNHPNHVYRA